MTNIMLVDDHALIREGLKSVLNPTDISIVGEANNATQALEQVEDLNPDVVLLDVRIPESEGSSVSACGLNILARIKQANSETAVLMFSGFDNPTYVARAASLGASGYLLKGVRNEKILEAIKTAAAGDHIWTKEEMRRVSGALSTPRMMSNLEVSLTQREFEVLQQMVTGKTNKEIAKILEISYETVKEHVQHILRKLGVSDRTQAAIWAVRRGVA